MYITILPEFGREIRDAIEWVIVIEWVTSVKRTTLVSFQISEVVYLFYPFVFTICFNPIKKKEEKNYWKYFRKIIFIINLYNKKKKKERQAFFKSLVKNFKCLFFLI